MKRYWLLIVGSALVLNTVGLADEYPIQTWKAWAEFSADRYPQAAWERYATPEEAGWSSDKLRDARQYYDTVDSAAVMVVYDGAVLAEWGDVSRRYMCHSIRKSLLSALYGVHVARGNIDLDQTMADLGIHDQPPLTDAEKQARVIDLLTSRSGVFHAAAYETPRMKEQRPERGSHAPGELFWYNNWDFNTLCTIFEQESGTRIFEEFQRQFAIPLGMEDYRLQDTYYHLEGQHSIHPAYPFRMSSRDMARFGLLFLREGRWGDKQILSQDWVQRSTASHFRQGDTTPNPQYGYGYLWWRIVDGPFKDLQMYSARGYGGHAIDVLPEANLVFVHRVDTYWDSKAPFREEKPRVKDSERFKLLGLVLDARVSPPKTNPKLAPLENCHKNVNLAKLDCRLFQRYAKQYQFERVTIRVKACDDRLSIGGPGIGDFSLLPLSETEFIIEDVQVPVTFKLDNQGNSTCMIIATTPDKEHCGIAIVP